MPVSVIRLTWVLNTFRSLISRNYIAALCFLLLSVGSTAQTVNSVKFEGLTRTRESFLRSLILCKEGSQFDTIQIRKDEQELKNLQLFFEVDASWKEVVDSSYDITYTIREARYLYPIFSIGGFQDQFKLIAGANHINISGKGDQFGAQYQYYDRHSFSVFYNAPRHKNLKTGHETSFSKYSTVEPLYFSDTVSIFNFDNYALSVGGFYWITRNLKVGLGGMGMYERYMKTDSAFIDIGGGMTDFRFYKYQIRTQLTYNKINQHFEFRDGIANNLFFETIQTHRFPEASFFKATNEFKWLKRTSYRGNLGFRSRLGIATNNFSPFAPFVIDGFINVRGSGNRVARGTAELIGNLEYRFSFLPNKWFFFQAVAFTVYGSLRPPGESFASMFEEQNQYFFLGGGLRVHTRFLYNMTLRLDYSFSPVDASQRGFTFGFGQFF